MSCSKLLSRGKRRQKVSRKKFKKETKEGADLAIVFPYSQSNMPVARNGRDGRYKIHLVNNSILPTHHRPECVYIALVASVWLHTINLLQAFIISLDLDLYRLFRTLGTYF